MDEIIEISNIQRPEGAMKYTNPSKKIVSNIEKIVRASYHYKIYIFYLKNFIKSAFVHF